MRIIKSPCGKQLQLKLVQETPLELTFQQGDRPRSSISIQKARIGSLIGLVIFILFIGAVWAVIYSVVNTKRDGFILPDSAFYGFYFFGILFTIIPLISIIFTPSPALFIHWTFDRPGQRIIKTTTPVWGQLRTEIYHFKEVKLLEVQEYHDYPHAHTELYMILKSGKELFLSASSYDFAESQKSDNLKYHQIIAEKIRHQVGL